MTSTKTRRPATVSPALSDLFFNSPEGTQGYEKFCLSGSFAAGHDRLTEAASAYLAQLKAIGAPITATPEELADNFLARV